MINQSTMQTERDHLAAPHLSNGGQDGLAALLGFILAALGLELVAVGLALGLTLSSLLGQTVLHAINTHQ